MAPCVPLWLLGQHSFHESGRIASAFLFLMLRRVRTLSQWDAADCGASMLPSGVIGRLSLRKRS